MPAPRLSSTGYSGLTSGLLQTSVAIFGSYFFDVVPHMFLKTMSEIVMLD